MTGVMGWEGIDGLLEAVQTDFPLAAPALGQIRGELAAMRYVLGVPLPEAGDVVRAPKQRQTVRDALAFAPSTEHAARDTVMDARRYGYTGSFCPDCGSDRMVRAGTCEHCVACGATTGCS